MNHEKTYKSFSAPIDTTCFAIGGKLKNYEFLAGLKEAHTSLIYKVSDVIDGQIKILRCWNEEQGELRQEVRESIERATEQCDYLMPITDHGIWRVGERFFYYEVYPFFPAGSLKNTRIEKIEVWRQIVEDLNEAVHALHRVGIVHGDVKPENIYWTDSQKNHVMLGDYDISEKMDQKGNTHSGHKGTIEYQPPCQQNYEWVRNKATDYGALGVTIHDLLTGKAMLAGKTESQIYKDWHEGLSIQVGLPADIKNLIINLTIFDAVRRWDYEQCRLWLSGEYVNEKKANQGDCIAGNERYSRLILAVEGDCVISVYSLEELGRLIPRYSEQFKRRFLTGKVQENKLLEFVRKLDTEKEEKTKEIIRKYEADVIVYKLAQLFYTSNDDEIIFMDKSYGSVEDIFNQMDAVSVDLNFLKVLRVEYENLCNETAREEMDRLIHIAGRDESFLYHLIRYVFGENKKFVGNDYEVSTIEELKKTIVQHKEIILEEQSQRRLLAWLYSMGFSKQITAYMEVINNE